MLAATSPDSAAATIDSTRAACQRALDELGPAVRPDGGNASRDWWRRQVEDFAFSAERAQRALSHIPTDAGDQRVTEVRKALLSTALMALDVLPDTPVPAAVKRRQCRLFLRFCERSDVERRFRPDRHHDARSHARCALLERFVAGQFDWEVSGLPRSYILRMPPSDLPRVLHTIMVRLRGLKPCFVLHMGLMRYPLLFTQSEGHRSYFQMAMAMRKQPRIRGILMISWFHSPETIRVSPHLAWVNQMPMAYGATLTNIGPASPDDGFLTSSHRKQLYESGAYRPTTGVLIWPREGVLAWADAHPEHDPEAISD